MEARTLMPVEEYLRTSFDGADRDYVHGEVLERNVGGNSHSRIQAALIILFHSLRSRTEIFPRPELRMQVNPGRFRIADVAVYAGREPQEEVPSEAPLVAIEILSPDDRMIDIVDRLQDYRVYGVAHIWMVDPWKRVFYVYGPTGLHEPLHFELPELDFRIVHSDLFS